MNRDPDSPFRLSTTASALVLALLAALLAFFLRPVETPFLDLLRRGDEYAAKTERTAAAAAYREAARLRPDDPLPHLRLARLYLEWGRTDEALDAIAAAGGRGAEKSELERLWVAVHRARADWPALVEHAHRLLALWPANPDEAKAAAEIRALRHDLAHAYVQLQRWNAAQAEYEKLLTTDPTDSLAHERLGALLVNDNDDGHAAIQHLFAAQTDLAERLLAALQEPGAADDPAYASALAGRVLFEAQEWALAAHQFERALAYDPAYADAHAYLGYALDQMDLPPEPEHEGQHEGHEGHEGRENHENEARSHLLRAVALAPESVVAHTFLGMHYERLGDLAAARAEYEAAYDLDPDNPATCVEIGHTWAAEGRYLAAEIWLREAVNLRPDDPTWWEILARFYLEHNITADGRGVEATAKLVELLPRDAHSLDLRGWAALQMGDYATAEEYLSRAIALDPNLAVAHYHMGQLMNAQGARHEARESFIRALDLDTTGELVPLVERAWGEDLDGFATPPPGP